MRNFHPYEQRIEWNETLLKIQRQRQSLVLDVALGKKIETLKTYSFDSSNSNLL